MSLFKLAERNFLNIRTRPEGERLRWRANEAVNKENGNNAKESVQALDNIEALLK